MTDPRNIASPSTKSGTFSPITVPASPASKIGQRGNLTGLPRTVRDSVADVYNLVQRWNKEHAEGCLILSRLTEIKKSSFLEANRDGNYDSLQPLCDLLESSCNAMDEIVARMQQISKELQAVKRLSDLHHQEKDYETPLFLTWTISQFVSMVQAVSDAYTKELQAKKLVLRRTALSRDETTLIFFVAVWVHQASLPSATVMLKVEAALVETGLR